MPTRPSRKLAPLRPAKGGLRTTQIAERKFTQISYRKLHESPRTRTAEGMCDRPGHREIQRLRVI